MFFYRESIIYVQRISNASKEQSVSGRDLLFSFEQFLVLWTSGPTDLWHHVVSAVTNVQRKRLNGFVRNLLGIYLGLIALDVFFVSPISCLETEI